MELNKYQESAMTTCMESCNNVAYMLYNLLGEVGELVEKITKYNKNYGELKEIAEQLKCCGLIAKVIRKNPQAMLSRLYMWIDRSKDELKDDVLLQKELGDIMWQLNGLMSVLGLKADDIAMQNLDKLGHRKERGVIDGDGDER